MTEFIARVSSLHPIVFSSIVFLIIILVLIGFIIGYCFIMSKFGIEIDDDDYDDDDDFDDE